MARYGVQRISSYARRDPKSYFPFAFSDEVLEGNGFGLPFEKFFELIARVRMLHVISSLTTNSGTVNLDFEVPMYGSYVLDSGGTTTTIGPVNELYIKHFAELFGTGVQTLSGDAVMDFRLDFSDSKSFYNSAQRLFYPTLSFRALDDDSSTGSEFPASNPGDAESTSVLLTIFGQSVQLFHNGDSEGFPAITGTVEVSFGTWWEFRDDNADLPIWNKITGEQIIVPIPMHLTRHPQADP